MRPVNRLWFSFLGLLLAIVVGCKYQKPLNEENTLSLEPGSYHSLWFSAPISEQKVNVTTSSPGAPVDVYVVLADNLEAGEKIAKDVANTGKAPDNPLGSKLKTDQASIDVKVPANKGFAVLVMNSPKNADAKVKVTSK